MLFLRYLYNIRINRNDVSCQNIYRKMYSFSENFILFDLFDDSQSISISKDQVFKYSKINRTHCIRINT